MRKTEPLRLTRAQVREIDRRAIEEYHVPGIVLMENAAIGATAVAREMLNLGDQTKRVLCVCGGGNNGGDGFAIARHLDFHDDINVLVVRTVDEKDLKGDALINWKIVRQILATESLDLGFIVQSKPDLIVDAIFGTGLDRPPRPPFDALADAINQSGSPVLAIDVPSGLDCDVGTPFGPCVRATRTVTFVAEKTGFANPAAHEFLGEVTVCGIGLPSKVIQKMLSA